MSDKLAQQVGAAAKRDPREWAHRLIEKHKSGQPVSPIALQKARDALSGDFRGRK